MNVLHRDNRRHWVLVIAVYSAGAAAAGPAAAADGLGTGLPDTRGGAAVVAVIEQTGTTEQAEPGRIAGTVLAAESGEPLAGTLVRLVEIDRRELTHGDGAFHFLELPAGGYTLETQRLGYRTERRTIIVEAGETTALRIALEVSALQMGELLVTGTIDPRTSAESLRPADVVSGAELERTLDATIAATLDGEPGIAMASVGPATARPVIRGLGGDRILILEDGQRPGDVSATAGDHAVAIDPVAARRIEVVRGPSALLYGSNALGGVVNVVREEIPSSLPDRPTGSVRVQGQTVNGSLAGGGSVLLRAFGPVAVRAEASARKAGDLATPVGVLENTSTETYSGAAGLGWISGWGHVGASFRYYDSSYGIPGGFVGGHDEGVTIDMVREAVKTEAHLHDGFGPFSSVELDGVYTRYHHRELEAGGALGTEFGLLTAAGEIRARHDGWGPLDSGAVGFRAEWRDFATGGSLGTPPAREHSIAGYGVQEIELGRFRFEFGARYDLHRVEPLDTTTSLAIGRVRTRTFGALSGSIGGLYEVADGLRVGASLARAYRTPDIGELFSEGPHLAAYSFEVGDPDLDEEVGLGADVFVRFTRETLQLEVAGYRNRIRDYIYPRSTGQTHTSRGLPIYQFTNADAMLTGLEASGQWSITPELVLDGTASYVRGTLTDTDQPLPLMPPFGGTMNLRFEKPSLFAGLGWKAAAAQDRVGEFETPTAGYNVFHAFGGYRWTLWGRAHSVTLRVDNITDAIYRNHLSRIKQIMPEAGRSVSLLYRLVF